MPEENASELKCAVVGVVGRTNAGKSSLVNRMVGEKISIVSSVQQTTRNTVRGILTESRGQLVFRDTPGLHKSESVLGTLMNRMARASAAGCDVLCVVFDASKTPHLEDDGWMRRAAHEEEPVVFVLNKSDKYAKDIDPTRPGLDAHTVAAFKDLWEGIQKEKKTAKEVIWVEANAMDDAGVAKLLEVLFSLAKPTPEYLFPEDVVTDYPRKLAIADVVREKFMRRLSDEVPHELGIRVDHIEEKGRTWNISATVFVSRPSQKMIVIGKKARTIRAVRLDSEPEISKMFDVKASLELWVKIEKDWMKNFWLLREMGYAGGM